MTGNQPVQRKETVMTDAHDRLANEIQSRVDRLINIAEATFRYIIDIQGDPIRDLNDTATLARVVNEHGKLVGELIRTVDTLGVLAAGSLKIQRDLADSQMELVQLVRELHHSVRELRGDLASTDDFVSQAVNRLSATVNDISVEVSDLAREVDDRTLVIPDYPNDV